MAAAAPLDFNGFLGQVATLGTVNTDGNGFIAAMAYALTEAGRLKSLLLLILHTREPLIFSGERRAGRKRERYRRKLRVDGQADSDEGRGPSSDLPGPTLF